MVAKEERERCVSTTGLEKQETRELLGTEYDGNKYKNMAREVRIQEEKIRQQKLLFLLGVVCPLRSFVHWSAQHWVEFNN